MIKDRAIAAGWIAGLLLVISLVLIFTKPAQARYLKQAVNNVLVEREYPFQLAAHMDRPRGKSSLFGFWYSMAGTSDTMFVFAFFRYGALVICGARISAAGTVMEIIPLSVHARQVFENIPQTVIQMHIRRIEAVISPLPGSPTRNARINLAALTGGR